MSYKITQISTGKVARNVSYRETELIRDQHGDQDFVYEDDDEEDTSC